MSAISPGDLEGDEEFQENAEQRPPSGEDVFLNPGSDSEGEDEGEDQSEDVSTSTDEEDENEREVAEAVFLQSYIPTSLHEISNPIVERQRLEAGFREQRMLGQEPGEAAVGRSRGREDLQDRVLQAAAVGPVVGAGEGMRSQGGGESDEEFEEGAEGEDDEGGEWVEEDGKYRRRLPHEEEARRLAKVKKREACRAVKELKAIKRENKIPKHVKKRAVKNGSKKH
eukprot:gene1650-1929_t